MNVHHNSWPGLRAMSLEEIKGRFGKTDEDIAQEAENEVRYPQYTPEPLAKGDYSRSSVSAFHNFIPNFLNSISTALRYFDDGQQPEMIWDCYLLLDIYYKIFTIPVGLTYVIGAVVSSTAVAAIAAAAVSIVGLGALYIYSRWLRSFPEKLTYETVKVKGTPDEPIVGRDAEIREILRYHWDSRPQDRKHILVIGRPGEGKTTMLRRAARELVRLHPELAVYLSQAPFAKSGKFNSDAVSRIRDALNLLGSLEKQTVFVIDELLSAVVSNASDIKADVAAGLKNLLDERQVTIWASGTIKDYEALKKYDSTHSRDVTQALLDRFHVIDFRNSEVKPEMMRAMVATDLLFKKSYVLCGSDVPQAAIELVKKHMPGKGLPREACNLIGDALATVRTNLNALNINTPELEEARGELASAGADYRFTGDGQGIEALRGRVKRLEDELAEKQKIVKKVETLCRKVHSRRKELYECAKKVQTNSKWHKKRFLHLKYASLPRKIRKIQQLEEEVGEEFPVRLTARVLEKELARQLRNG